MHQRSTQVAMRRLLSFLLAFPINVVSAALFDVFVDPYEIDDLSLNSSYVDILNTLQSRLAFHATRNGVASLVSMEGSPGKVYAAAGGVFPWLDSSIPTPLVRNGVATARAPNLVFILLDDLGWK